MAEAAIALDNRSPDADDMNTPLVKHVTFSLGEELYAVGAASVNEVLRYTEITPVPGAPAFVLGIINLRGDVVTVVDARSIFALSPHEVDNQSRIVVVEVEDYLVGVLVDRVSAVVDLRENEMEISPNTGSEAATQFIQGVYNEDDELLILVDFSRLAQL